MLMQYATLSVLLSNTNLMTTCLQIVTLIQNRSIQKIYLKYNI